MIPTWLQAIILGVVQGLTEFVPVSSSGHLVLVPYVLGWDRPGLPFDVALHAGTAVAVIVYFRTELVGILLAVLRRGRDPTARFYRRLLALLVLASVPVAVVGLTLRDTVEALFQTPAVVGGALLVTAAVLLTGEWARRRRLSATSNTPPAGAAAGGAAADPPRTGGIADVGVDPHDPAGTTLAGMGPRIALGVGVAQAFALFPGLSRSGLTITAGVVSGLTRVAATRFAFLLSLPALIGASVVSLPGLSEAGPYSGADIAAGVAAATLASYLAIAFLIRFVARAGLTVFAAYLVVAGVAGLVAVTVLGPAP